MAAKIPMLYLPDKEFSSRYGADTFTTSLESYEKVTSPHPQATGNLPAIFYKIIVKCGDKKWEVLRRYSEFDSLKAHLLTLVNNNVNMSSPLPAKTCFKAFDDHQLCEDRLVGLSAFLESLLLENRNLMNDESLVLFLGIIV
tara:strand:+ start:171 stop:596 length:426 start_codon:yes stop_codon:yes gene_type:complete